MACAICKDRGHVWVPSCTWCHGTGRWQHPHNGDWQDDCGCRVKCPHVVEKEARDQERIVSEVRSLAATHGWRAIVVGPGVSDEVVAAIREAVGPGVLVCRELSGVQIEGLAVGPAMAPDPRFDLKLELPEMTKAMADMLAPEHPGLPSEALGVPMGRVGRRKSKKGKRRRGG